MTIQTRIDREVDAVRVLLVIQGFQERDLNGDESPGLVWTTDLFCTLLGWATERAENVLKWLRRQAYLTTYRGEHRITDLGKDFIVGALERIDLSIATTPWVNEVLTGIRPGGQRNNANWQRSRIDNAVLPGPPKAPCEERTPEDEVTTLQMQAREAKKLGLTLEEFREGVQNFRIRICKAGSNDAHIGIFHNGQTACRDCRKRRRG